MTGHLEKHHAEEWGAYCEIRKRTKAEVAAVKKEEVESCEMENSEVRFYDVRSSKGRLPFLAKLCFGEGYVEVSRNAYMKSDEIKKLNHPILDLNDVFCVQGD